MTTATLNIGKKLTVVTGGVAYSTKLSEVVAEASQFDVIALKGITSSNKMAKYLASMVANGYKVISEEWMREDYPVKGAVDFSIQLAR